MKDIIDDIMNNRAEAEEVLNELSFVLERLNALERMFPLQTQQSLADRWGVARQTVAKWSKRHVDFPKPVEGLIAETTKTRSIYPMHEVKKYEMTRGLKK